tara:strand:- start:3454 stop:4383 length:930 start_codon:yes stop_codon:yes gene_type:complete
MKIIITGGTGMIGTAFKNLKTDHELISVGSSDYNLKDSVHTKKMILEHTPDAIIHLAARVGGVKGNSDHVADFFHENIMINTNVLSTARELNVPKVVSVLSTCVYPDKVTYPLTEEQMHMGPPHESNFGYAYAKRMLDVHTRALRQQYGKNYTCAIPNNLYGPNDNFDLSNGHVVPSVIRKIWEAKINKNPAVFWGSGKPLREFTLSSDFAQILLWMTENYNSSLPLNVGNTAEFSIHTLVQEVCNILEYNGEVVWDKSMPEGQFKKPSSNQKFIDLHGELDYTELREGLKITCDWFLQRYPKVRGVSK